MDVGIRAGRDQRAQERIVKAAATLTELLGLPELVLPTTRDKAVEGMLQREVVAGMLETLAAWAESATASKRAKDAADAVREAEAVPVVEVVKKAKHAKVK
jgi:hypothetical protein